MAASTLKAQVYLPASCVFSSRVNIAKQSHLGIKVRRHLALHRRDHCTIHRDSVVMASLRSGDRLPAIPSLETDESVPGGPKTLSLSDVVKDTGAVIFVYPKADTSGCTKQACGFNDNLEKFAAAGYKIFGLSADSPPAQAAWKKKEGYRYTLLSDPSHEVLKALGVSDGSSIKRSHFIVEKGGELRDIRYGISSGDSVPEALKAVGAAGDQVPKPSFSSL